jgi:hypothetical protein
MGPRYLSASAWSARPRFGLRVVARNNSKRVQCQQGARGQLRRQPLVMQATAKFICFMPLALIE